MASSTRTAIAVFLFLGLTAVVAVITDLPALSVLAASIVGAAIGVGAVWAVVLVREAGAMSRAATFARDLESRPGCVAVGVVLHGPGRTPWLGRKCAVLYADESGVALLAHEGAGRILCEDSWSSLSALEIHSRTYLGQPSSALLRFEGRMSPLTELGMAPIEITGRIAGVTSRPLGVSRRIAALRTHEHRS